MLKIEKDPIKYLPSSYMSNLLCYHKIGIYKIHVTIGSILHGQKTVSSKIYHDSLGGGKTSLVR